MLENNPIRLSICFCAWNEQDNISDCIQDALANAPTIVADEGDFEILVIDNASTDRTPDVVNEWHRKDPRVRLVRHDENRLYSGSHRTAFSEARGEHIAIIDGDYQHTARDISKGIGLMERTSSSVVFGWKKTRHDGLLRQIFSIGLRLTSQYLIGHHLHDINCGFRVFTKKAARSIQIQEKVNSVGPEIYCECRRLGFGVGEIVVEHFPRTKGEGLHNTILPLLRSTKKFLDYLLRLRARYGVTTKLPVHAQ